MHCKSQNGKKKSPGGPLDPHVLGPPMIYSGPASGNNTGITLAAPIYTLVYWSCFYYGSQWFLILRLSSLENSWRLSRTKKVWHDREAFFYMSLGTSEICATIFSSCLFYWPVGKFGIVSRLLCSCKLADDASTDQFLLTCKGAHSSLSSKFGGWWKCSSCATKFVRSNRNTCNMGLMVHTVLFLLRTSPRNDVPSTTSKGGWRRITGNQTVSTGPWAQVFCRCHRASSGICRQWSLLTRNTQI